MTNLSDGFDLNTNDVTIQDCTIINQDDCIAINSGHNIIFQRNTCIGGHGISIGSVNSGAVVSNVRILNNKVINNSQALRIKTDATATGASVADITYSGNTATGITKYGVLIDQSYSDSAETDSIGLAGNGVRISVSR
jgi:galacturan 1,4-alpha-galacturonidase